MDENHSLLCCTWLLFALQLRVQSVGRLERESARLAEMLMMVLMEEN